MHGKAVFDAVTIAVISETIVQATRKKRLPLAFLYIMPMSLIRIPSASLASIFLALIIVGKAFVHA